MLKKIYFGIIALMLNYGLFGQVQKAKFTMEDIFLNGKFSAQGFYSGLPVEGTTEFYSIIKNGANQPVIIKTDSKNTNKKDTILSLAGIRELEKGVESFQFSKDKKFILFQTESQYIFRHSAKSKYYLMNFLTKEIQSVAKGEKVFYATFSPNSLYLTYVINGNLEFLNIPTGAVTRINPSLKGEIINGKSDWVYEEEFALVKAFEYSPDGNQLIYLRFDESRVKEVSLPVYDSVHWSSLKYKYPKVGDENSIVSLHYYDLVTGISKQVKVGEENDQYIPRIFWKDNLTFGYFKLNRLQNSFDIFTVSKEDFQQSRIYNEKSNTYVEVPEIPFFLKDNSFFLSSEKEGLKQLYHFSALGILIRKITSQPGEFIEAIKIDEKSRKIIFTAKGSHTWDKKIYTVGFNGTELIEWFPNESGSESISLTGNEHFFIISKSSNGKGPNYGLYEWKKKVVALKETLEENKSLNDYLGESGIQSKVFEEITINNTKLSAWKILPPNFNPSKKYPVMICIYSGPGSQQVINGYGGGNDAWYNYLAAKDIIVYCVDGRGTGGRGTAFKKQTYKQLGLLESDDVIATAKYLGTFPYVDSKRIGIFGWSFGGYMSSMCLFRGNDVFKMAVSVAPVTDWRYYDNIYTERFMQRTVENKDGYENTSVLKYVDKMKESQKLLLIHGTLDDNVHPQNSFMLIEKLVKQGKKFDSEFYTNKSHSINGGNTRLHIYNRITDFILLNL